jgi:hypothetical protein
MLEVAKRSFERRKWGEITSAIFWIVVIFGLFMSLLVDRLKKIMI